MHRLVYRATYAVAALRPVRPGSVLLVTNRSPRLVGNLKYIRDYLAAHPSPVSSVTEIVLPGGRAGLRRRFRAERALVWRMATTQYTVVDDFLPAVYPLRLRRGTRLIQVWHALGALKRMGYSRGGRGGGPASDSLAHKNYTDVIVSADGVRSCYAEAFAVPLHAVRATGAPRSDLFFDQVKQAEARVRLLERVPTAANRRVIVFAPTFRGPSRREAHYPAKFLDLDRLGAALGGDDLFVIRHHPFVTTRVPIPSKWADRIIDLSDYPEFNDLLLACDLLVTDYSSAIFDYALLRRPAVFYVPDLADYIRDRGFYDDFAAYTYGPVVQDFDGLLGALGTTVVDEAQLARFRERFLNRCDGHATERFVGTVLPRVGAPVVAPLGSRGARNGVPRARTALLAPRRQLAGPEMGSHEYGLPADCPRSARSSGAWLKTALLRWVIGAVGLAYSLLQRL
ncbi:MAG: CDP-glycerol glycerophosphotransferase family protein, partial [Propionibacteriaceae bacterium]|nr:CDP-glycerol glycerophosphotransferase family protein [Propionibacteriaceae bacterium]